MGGTCTPLPDNRQIKDKSQTGYKRINVKIAEKYRTKLKIISETFGCFNKSTYLCTAFGEMHENDALVAQLVEHLTLNQGVQGSTPCRRTKTTKT